MTGVPEFASLYPTAQKRLCSLRSARARLASKALIGLSFPYRSRSSLVESVCVVTQLGTAKPLLARIDEA